MSYNHRDKVIAVSLPPYCVVGAVNDPPDHPDVVNLCIYTYIPVRNFILGSKAHIKLLQTRKKNKRRNII